MSAYEYASPQSIEEAVAILSSRSEARPLAGGQTMLVGRNRDRLEGAVLVDLGRISSLRGIARQDGGLRIGATTTLSTIASSDLVGKEYPALAEAAGVIGDAQLRNRGTIGGNIAEGDPEYDLPALLLALNASVQVAGPQGPRNIAAEHFFKQTDRRPLKQDEFVASVSIPRTAANSGMAYVRFKHPARLTAVCAVAAVMTVKDGRVSAARIALTGAADHPTRLEAVEKALLNKPADLNQVTSGAAASDEGIAFRSDLFASAEYRHHLTRVLIGRALKQALSQITT
ncbi:MAG: FAD binding domain-containing protein [Bryobacteraceae bacterium]